MLKKNKPNYCIALFVRKQKVVNKNKVFDLVVAKKSRHSKHFVIEKLGAISFRDNKITINFFRLIYWTQFGPAVTPKAWKLLSTYIIKKNW